MSLEYGILGLLNYGKMSGYDIAKAFDSSLKFFWHAQNSHIYLELKKLEKKGYITGEVVQQHDRPNKRLFTITADGKAAFMEWLAASAGDEPIQFKSAFLMRIFFAGNITPEQSAALLREFRQHCVDFLNGMSEIPETIDHYGSNKEMIHPLYWQMTAEFGYGFIRYCIDWAESCIKKLHIQ